MGCVLYCLFLEPQRFPNLYGVYGAFSFLSVSVSYIKKKYFFFLNILHLVLYESDYVKIPLTPLTQMR